MSLGDRIKAVREERGLSRAKLAHDAGQSYAFIQQLETGVRDDPGASRLAAVARVLQVSMDNLLVEADASPISRDPGTPTQSAHPARQEIDQMLDAMPADELVSIRDLLRIWLRRAPASGATTPSTSAE